MGEEIASRAALRRLANVVLPQAIAVLNHLGVADAVGSGMSVVDDIAVAVGAHGPTLYRIMRYVA